MEDLILLSSCCQSCMYQRLIASTRSRMSSPAPGSHFTRQVNCNSSSFSLSAVLAVVSQCSSPATFVQSHSASSFLWSPIALAAMVKVPVFTAVAKRLRVANLPRQKLRVDGAAIDLLERDPVLRQYPMKLDDPADQIGVGLLPERLLALAEQLIEQRGNGVGQRVGIEPPGRERVPPPSAAHAEFHVVAASTLVQEDLADVMAEVPLDFQHQGRRPPVRVSGLPAEKL